MAVVALIYIGKNLYNNISVLQIICAWLKYTFKVNDSPVDFNIVWNVHIYGWKSKQFRN